MSTFHAAPTPPPVPRSIVAHHSHDSRPNEIPYFEEEIRTFLRDTTLTNEKQSRQRNRDHVLGQSKHEHLLMPRDVQKKVFSEICLALNKVSGISSSEAEDAGIPYAPDYKVLCNKRLYSRTKLMFQPVIVYDPTWKAYRQHKYIPLRQLIQRCASKMMRRSNGSKVRFHRDDAEFSYSLLDLTACGKVLLKFSQAYNGQTERMPVEIESILTEVLSSLPSLPSGKDAMATSSLSGLVETVSIARGLDFSNNASLLPLLVAFQTSEA